jgi:two-component system, cell cycle sensor histidine kinase and response regulator CckA
MPALPNRDLRRGLTVFLSVCLIFATDLRGAATPSLTTGSLLVLNSYHLGYTWSDYEMEGILGHFRQDRPTLDPLIEYLDCKHFPGNEHFDALANLLALKYASHEFPVVIVADNPALEFALKYRPRLFPRAGIIFCGINGFTPDMLQGQSRVTGIAEQFDTTGTLDAALAIQPNLRNVYVIIDYTPTGQATRREAMEAIPRYAGRLQFRFSRDVPVEAVLKEVSKLTPDSIVLLMSYSADGTGRVFDHVFGTQMIRRESPVPVYGVHESRLGSGIIGGSLLSGRAQGQAAAELSCKVFDGTDIGQIPIVRKPTVNLVFDSKELRTFGIPQSLLPPGATVINVPESLFHRHRMLFISTILILLALSLLVVVMAFNIIRRRQAEESLRRREAIYRRAIAASEAVAYQRDYSLPGFTFIDPGIETLTGYTPSELTSDVWREIIQEYVMRGQAAGMSLTQASMTARAGGISEWRGDYHIRTRSGEEKWLADSSVLLVGPDGHAQGSLGILQDITDRKRAEEALRDALQRFEAVIEQTPHVAIQGFERDGTVRHWNTACADLYGYTQTEALGKKLQDLLLSEESGIEFQKSIHGIWDSGHALPPQEWSVRDRHGKSRWVYSAMFPVFDGGRVVEIFCMDIDITARKEAEEERRRLEAQVLQAQKLESLGVLAGGIAHDFNNLLTTILGNADLALGEMPEDMSARASIQQIVTAATRAADLAKQMLAFSGKGKFVVQPVDLNELVREMAGLLEVSVSKKCAITCQLAPDLPHIMADAGQVRQVALNLILNASEAIGDHVGTVAVTTGTMQCDRAFLADTYLDEHLPEGLYVYLQVADTGCGMDEDTLARIFDPFFTTKFTGRGLGLASVLGIVRGHGGAIRLRSKVGEGTVFMVLFPTSSEQAADSTSHPPQDAVAWRGSGTVLVADDDDAVRALARRILQKAGFNVLTATDGREAVELFRSHADELKLVILDWQMPDMDGQDAFREIRRIRADARVILSSGYDEQDTMKRFAGEGLSGYAQKPYRQREFVAVVRQVLGE